jgi:splicing factor 3A subunit 1
VGMVTATTSVASAPENERPTVQRQVGDTAKPAAIVTTTTVGKASLLNPIAKILMSKPVAPPAAFEFSLGHPSGIGALDADVIRLTAQYTAANGRDFLGGLASREQSNPQFDFLRPTHLLFSYFTSLVDAYSKALHPDEALQSRMRILADRSGALEQAVRRWEWSRREDERKKR